MRAELQVSDLSSPSDVHGVHGAAGVTQWRSLAGGRGLRGPYEAVEWACVPPGGLSGEHLHTRTEEIYVLLTGRGEALLNGVPHPVRAGQLVVTGLGATHGLRNTGPSPLSWLTLEVPAPRTLALAGTPRKDAPMAPLPDGEAVIVDLGELRDVDPRPTLQGPLRRIRLLEPAPGAREHLPGQGFEHTVFVLEGTATASGPSGDVALREGMAVTTSGGEDLTITGSGGGFKAVCASFVIPSPHGTGTGL
ncbi:cupin domain-containing protein [Streptomyces sp. NBC_01478]|uniref:cupin domain-containing protein n=1 Tax=Streptomyces sp. NBC_01478 TaxID=2903882 RepID=UPI002E3425E3|nr:cupin domain-containing protein [Streptomyces sp. NBC_01478]